MYNVRIYNMQMHRTQRPIAITLGTSFQIAVGAILALAWCIIYAGLHPFLDPEADHLAIIAQISTFIQLFFALMIVTEVLKAGGVPDAITTACLLMSNAVVTLSTVLGPIAVSLAAAALANLAALLGFRGASKEEEKSAVAKPLSISDKDKLASILRRREGFDLTMHISMKAKEANLNDDASTLTSKLVREAL